MKAGDTVRVYPHGHPEMTAEAAVALISNNERSIALTFADKPPFMWIEGYMIHPELGIVMLAGREELNGKPWGPWVEMIGGGHYEIEP